MPLEFQAPHTKNIHHKKKGLQLPVQDSLNIDPRPSKKRRREDTGTEIVMIEDRNGRKRRKKEDKTRRGALKEDIQPISSVQELGPAIVGTLEGEPKKAKTRKDEDARTVEEPSAKVCETLNETGNEPDRQMSGDRT